jgi:hypothetical protein
MSNVYKRQIKNGELGYDLDDIYLTAFETVTNNLYFLAGLLRKDPIKVHTEPQRTYQDMHNQIANELTKLPCMTAKVRSPDGERTMTVSRPDGALNDGWMPDVTGYTKSRVEIDAEIMRRQKTYTAHTKIEETRIPEPEERPALQTPKKRKRGFRTEDH